MGLRTLANRLGSKVRLGFGKLASGAGRVGSKMRSAYDWADQKTGGAITSTLKQHGGDVLRTVGQIAGATGGPVGQIAAAGLNALGNRIDEKYGVASQSPTNSINLDARNYNPIANRVMKRSRWKAM